MTGALLKHLEQRIWWSSQKDVLPPRGALRKSGSSRCTGNSSSRLMGR